MQLNCNTVFPENIKTEPIRRALCALQRDFHRTFLVSEESGAALVLVQSLHLPKECFVLRAAQGRLEIQAGDQLGFIYGIYAVSRQILGIQNFWFWMDQRIKRRQKIVLPEDYRYVSEPFQVNYRGWFLNDEVLLQAWRVDGSSEKPWEMAFEALLRCGGNLVIPGTDRNAQRYRQLASDMGLMITHHHAEPLGAEMFSRAYPALQPSYGKYPEKFQHLWRESIRAQKGMRVLWNLGFRGQGDCPFWAEDDSCTTAQERGALMSRLIRLQYQMVKKEIPDAICCTNLYGEIMELYRDGYLQIPKEIIRVWADNGYGKMVTRRQGNNNPRIVSLPQKEDTGAHGIYYHVSFYDLQAANHITLLPNSPEFVQKQLQQLLQLGVSAFWIVNCSNIKPHVYFLDFIAEIWHSGSVNIENHRKAFVSAYYGSNGEQAISECLRAYWEAAVPYGSNEDEHAGEQFPNYVTRILICQFRKDRTRCAQDLLWATRQDTFKGQVEWYEQICYTAQQKYSKYRSLCEKAAVQLEPAARLLFEDSLLLQARVLYFCFHGAWLFCKSLESAFTQDYCRAFYLAGKAREAYLEANQAMRSREHGKWNQFYANECLTDVKQTAWVLEGLMSDLRSWGEGPHYYQWQREFLYAQEDRRVVLITNMENHLRDQELFAKMKERWDE